MTTKMNLNLSGNGPHQVISVSKNRHLCAAEKMTLFSNRQRISSIVSSKPFSSTPHHTMSSTQTSQLSP